MAKKEIPVRSEVPEEYTWNLKDLFESDEAWLTEMEALRGMIPGIASYEGRLQESADTLLAFFRASDDIMIRLSTLFGYASQKCDEDTNNSFYQDLRGKAMAVNVAIASASAYSDAESSLNYFQRRPRVISAAIWPDDARIPLWLRRSQFKLRLLVFCRSRLQVLRHLHTKEFRGHAACCRSYSRKRYPV